MSEKKEIHIVFQVLNYLYGEDSELYKLSADEQLMLITLAHHKGIKGIYPSISTLARELKRDYSSIKRTLKRLESKKLIIINRNLGKSSDYYLNFLSNRLSTTQGVDASSSVNASGGVDALGGRAYTHQGVGRRRPTINTDTNIKEQHRERAQKRRPALSDSFLPNDENLILAKDLRLNIDDEVESFKNRHKGKKTQYEFSRWLKTAKEYQNRAPAKVEPPKLKEWSVKDWEEEDKRNRAIRAKEEEEIRKQIDASTPETEYVPFKERVRRYNEKHGVLTNGNGTDQSSNIGGRSVSTKN